MWYFLVFDYDNISKVFLDSRLEENNERFNEKLLEKTV